MARDEDVCGSCSHGSGTHAPWCPSRVALIFESTTAYTPYPYNHILLHTDEGIHPMTTETPTAADLAAAKEAVEKARDKRNKAQEKLRAAEAHALEVNNALVRQTWPKEPSYHAGVLGGRRIPAVVTFDKKGPTGSVFTYAAVRPATLHGEFVDKAEWYVTGTVTTPFTWDGLLEWMGEHGRMTLVTAQRWGRTK